MRAFPSLFLGLWLILQQQGGIAQAHAAVWSAEAGTNGGRLLLVWPQPTGVTLDTKGNIARVRADRPLTSPASTATLPLAAWLLDATPRPDGTELALRLRPGVVASLRQLHPRLTVIEFAHAPASTAAAVQPMVTAVEPAAGPFRPIPVPHSRPELVAAPDQPMPGHVAVEPAPGAPQREVKVAATSSPGGLEVQFRWGKTVPAAMFEHRRQLWVVFPGGDAEVAGWRSLSRPEVTAWLEPVTTSRAGNARLFRFRLPRQVRIEPKPAAFGWAVIVTPEAGASTPEAPLVNLVRDPVQRALVAESGGVMAQLRDPETSERLDAFLAPPGGLRQPAPARLVDLELLPTLQGLAWRPLADGVRAEVTPEGQVSISRPGGLRLSQPETQPAPTRAASEVAHTSEGVAPVPGSEHREPVPTHHEPQAELAKHVPPDVGMGAPAGALGLARLGGLDAAGRQKERRRISGDLRALTGPPRAKARLDLARLYLADALGPEARTALELIDEADLGTVAAKPLRASRTTLSGAAEALSGRPDTALAHLLDHALDADAEIALWRAYAAARASRWQLAAQEWHRSAGIPEGYPDPLRQRLGLELAAGLLDHGDAVEARALLAQLDGIGLTGEDGARLRLLQGIAHSHEGRLREAAAAFALARDGSDGDIAARAEFLLASAQVELGELAPQAAVHLLKASRSGWRGHPWEARMLTRLAELQEMAEGPATAIATRVEAIARTAEPQAAEAARGALRRKLAEQLDGSNSTPLARLALHRAHGDLLDGDPDAPRLRASLAEAAVAAGLIETAAALVERAGGTDRSALAAALAARGDVEGALRHLGGGAGDATRAAAELRSELVARAALARGDLPEAMAAAATAGTANARALAREIALAHSDWQEIARTAGADLAAADGVATLDPAQAEAAIWLGLAQARMGRGPEAQAAAERYAARIASRPQAALLRLAALAGTPGGATELGPRLRTELAELPGPAAGSGGIRSASARSAPQG